MNRRQLLTASLAAFLPVSGCVGSGTVFGDPIRFRLRYVEILNWTQSPHTVTTIIERDGSRVFDDSETIPETRESGLQSWRIEEPWMDETAEYTVSLDVDGGSSVTTSTRDVAESYDLSRDEERCLRWTFQLRSDGSIGVFPNFACPSERG